MRLDGDPPRLGLLRWWVGATWATSVVGVVGGILAGEWTEVAWSSSASISAAGWWLAARRWAEWRSLAIATLAAAAYVLREDEDEGEP